MDISILKDFNDCSQEEKELIIKGFKKYVKENGKMDWIDIFEKVFINELNFDNLIEIGKGDD